MHNSEILETTMYQFVSSLRASREDLLQTKGWNVKKWKILGLLLLKKWTSGKWQREAGEMPKHTLLYISRYLCVPMVGIKRGQKSYLHCVRKYLCTSSIHTYMHKKCLAKYAKATRSFCEKIIWFQILDLLELRM